MPVPPPTARLAFREMTPHDLDDMAALLSDPDVMRYYPRPKSREAAAWIAWCRRLYQDHGFGLWLVTLRDTGEFVGDCGLTPQQVDGQRQPWPLEQPTADLRDLSGSTMTECRELGRLEA